MPKRVNTPFVIVLAAVLIVLTAGVVLAWYFVRTTPDEFIARGKVLLDQGEPTLALEQFSKAIAKDPQNVQLLMLYADTITETRVSDARKARDDIKRMRIAWQSVLTLEPAHPEAFSNLMGMYQQFATEMGLFNLWSRVYESCQQALARHPDWPEAIKFRGMAQTHRMGHMDFDDEERIQAEHDLLTVLDHDPDDLDVHFHLVLWHLKEADLAERIPPTSPEEAAKHKRIARQLSEQMYAQFKNVSEAQLNHLRLLVQIRSREAALPLMDQLEQRVLAELVPVSTVVHLAELLPVLDYEEVPFDSGRNVRRGLQRAEAILRLTIERTPSDVLTYAALGRVLKAMEKTDDAMEIFKQGREVSAQADPISIHLLSHLQLICTLEYTELRLDQLADVDDVQEREIVLFESQELVEETIALTGEIWQVNRLQGKIAMVRSDWEEARAQFDRASELTGDTNPELLMLSARIRGHLGERGAAIDRYKQLIELIPDYLPAHADLARLYMRLMELDEAELVIEQMLQVEPGNWNGWRLKAALLIRRGQNEEAIEVIEQMNPESNPSLLPTLADYYRRAGNVDRAKELFEQFFADHPTNLPVLRELISVSSDKEEALAYLDRAGEAGVDEQILRVLKSGLDGVEVDVEKTAEVLIEQGTEFEKHLKRYRVLKQLRKSEEALAELEEAAKLDPDDRDLIELQFGEALTRSDWERADQLAGRAGEQNLDRGGGHFYYGQLFYAQGEFESSVASFRNGLDQRGVYSTGWRELGDAQLAMGDPSEAVVSFKTAVKQRPDNVDARRGLARVYHREGEHADALEQLRKAVEYAPTNGDLRSHYLSYEQKHGDTAKALEFCWHRAQSDPQDFAIRRLLAIVLAKNRQREQAIETIDQVIQEDGLSLVNIRSKAVVLAEGGDIDAGRQTFQDYLTAQGEQTTTTDWMTLGRFLFDYGQIEAGTSVFRLAAETEDPVQRLASRELANRLFQVDQVEQAADLYASLWSDESEDQVMGLRYAEAMVRLKKFKVAENVLVSLVEKFPDDGRTHMVEGLLAQAKGQMDRALEAYNRSILASPHWPMAYYQRAQLLAMDPRYDSEVIDDLNKALELNRDLAVAWRKLAQVHLGRGDRDDAVRELQALLRRTPGDYPARLLLTEVYFQNPKNILVLRQLLEESVKLFPTDPTWPLLHGSLEQREGRIEQAIAHLRRAVDLQPFPNTIGKLASLLMLDRQPEAVLDLVREHAEFLSTQPQLQALHARALLAVGKEDEALDTFSQAMAACESHHDVYSVAQQIVNSRLGFDRAIEVLEGLSTGDQAVQVELVLVQLISTRGDYEGVLERLEKLDALMAPDALERAVYNQIVALAYYRSGDYQAAKTTYERMLERAPNDVRSLKDLAYILANHLEEPQVAIELAMRASSLEPDNPAVLDTLGWAHFKAGNLVEARRVLLRSVEVKPMGPNCLHLAEVMLKENDRQRARELLDSAIQLAEKNNEWRVVERARKMIRVLNIQDISSQ